MAVLASLLLEILMGKEMRSSRKTGIWVLTSLQSIIAVQVEQLNLLQVFGPTLHAEFCAVWR
jgi:hypothetical protein